MRHSKAMSEAERLKDKAMDGAEELAGQALDTVEQGAEKVNQVVERTASLTPTMLFAGAALASIAVSLFLQLRGRRHWGLFVGHWAPTFLLFGLYNKLSKTVGAA
jgi:hypothetical protein